ncbi:MAG: hypothetical protein HYV97_17900 [Bdellovibrio sp.]|nr:hypothetical protein [Bdellovibrio sp.]
MIIGTTRLCFSEGREIPGMLALTFDGFSKVDLEAFHQRANFYHFREKKNLPPELAFDLPQLETKENDLCLRWRDWNGWQWTFKTHHEHGQHSSN